MKIDVELYWCCYITNSLKKHLVFQKHGKMPEHPKAGFTFCVQVVLFPFYSNSIYIGEWSISCFVISTLKIVFCLNCTSSVSDLNHWNVSAHAHTITNMYVSIRFVWRYWHCQCRKWENLKSNKKNIQHTSTWGRKNGSKSTLIWGNLVVSRERGRERAETDILNAYLQPEQLHFPHVAHKFDV